MWVDGGAYERFMGRWSRQLADRLVEQLLAQGATPGRWLDVGCGTGSVTAAALAGGVSEVIAVEPSEAFAAAAAARFAQAPVTVHVADATSLPPEARQLDAVVSALVLNFTPDPAAALRHARAALATGGLGLFAVWDYTDPRSFLTRFWGHVQDVTGDAAARDERASFGQDDLARAAAEGGWDADVLDIDVITTFVDHDDLWQPFLTGTGPAGACVAALEDAQRAAVRDRFVADVFGGGEGPVAIPFRAMTVSTTADR